MLHYVVVHINLLFYVNDCSAQKAYGVDFFICIPRQWYKVAASCLNVLVAECLLVGNIYIPI